MVGPLSLILAGAMGAQRAGGQVIAAKQARGDLKGKIKDLRARRTLLGVRKQEVGEGRDAAKSKLMSSRGLFGPTTEGQRVDTVHARAMQRLAFEEDSLNRAIRNAKRARRLAKYSAYTGWVPEAAAVGLYANEFGGGSGNLGPETGTSGLAQGSW